MVNPAPISDEQLMRAYLDGDSGAFAELYQRHSSRIYSYLRKRLSNSEEVDEVFQAAFMKAHNSRRRYDFAYPVAQWFYVITKTTLLDHFRKQGRTVQAQELTPELSQTIGSDALSEERELEILENLNPDQRRIVELRVFDELSYQEIAKKLGRTQESIRQTLSRALKKLRMTWKEES